MKKSKRNFKKLSNVEHVRIRTGMWLGQNSLAEFEQHFFKKKTDNTYLVDHEEITEIPAKLKCLDEVCMNAIDEYNRNLKDKSIPTKNKMKELNVTLSADKKRITVRDDGRGIPAKNAEAVFLHLMYGENFDDLSKEEHIAGQNGVGVSLVRIVSRYFKVVTENQGRRYTKCFTLNDDFKKKIRELGVKENLLEKIFLHFDEQGNFNDLRLVDESIKRKIIRLFNKSSINTKLENIDKNLHGTEVSFELEPKYFDNLDVSYKENYLEQYLQDLAMTNPGLIIYFHHLKKKQEFFFKNGLSDIFSYDPKSYYRLLYENKKTYFKLEAIIKKEEGKSLNWVNANFVSLGGSSIEYLHNRIYDEIRKKPSLISYEKRLKYAITRNDIRQCFHMYNNFHLIAPRFKSQDKSYLINDLKEEIRKIVSLHLDKMIRKLDLINKIKEVVARKIKIRELDKVDKEMKKTSHTLIPKFIPCTSKKTTEKKVLFLGEGDSAIAGLRPVRNPQFHALFPLRGKPLNVREMPFPKIMMNEEFKNIVRILNLPAPNQECQLENLNFNQVVIITDADFDGYAIRSLILSFFYEYWPKLFQYDFIYLAEAPLYEVELENSNKKREIFYCIDDGEFDALLKKAQNTNCRLVRKKRNKGLGETSKSAMTYAIENCLTKVGLKNNKKASLTQNLWFHKSLAHERRNTIAEYQQLFLQE